jgi:hypothetical protein
MPVLTCIDSLNVSCIDINVTEVLLHVQGNCAVHSHRTEFVNLKALR